jgi:hypothetical protein
MMPLPRVWIFAAALLAAACQSERKPATPPPPPASVTIHANDFSFDAPTSIPAGITTVHLVNDGPGLHHALFVRLDSGKTVADLLASLKTLRALPAWVTYVGGPTVPDPGKESVATLDLTPGNYAIICILDVPGGVPHYMRGMYRALTVTAAPGTAAAMPRAVAADPDNTLVLSDYVFAIAHPITAGTHTFLVVTSPGEPHDVIVVRLDAGKTGQDYVKWIDTMNSPAPGHIIGGTAPASPGVVQSFTATFTPGDYLLMCLVLDMKNHKPHFMEGMIKTVRVD